MYCYILLYYLCIVIYKWYDTDYEICNIEYIVYTHIYICSVDTIIKYQFSK